MIIIIIIIIIVIMIIMIIMMIIMDFADTVNHTVKVKESEERDKCQEFAREL